MLSWIAVLALASSLAPSAHGAPIPRFVFVDGSERLMRRIDCSEWKGRPGFAIAVLHRDALLLRQDCGLADVARREPIGPETRFHLGEVSKTFTAAAVLLLYERKQLALDDPVARHFPELPAWAESVRVMHLLHHTSGLPEPPEDARSADEVIRFLRRQTALSFEPGSDVAPGAAGYVLLAELVKRASGTPFATFIEREVLRPLALDHTSVFDESAHAIPGLAVGYRVDAGDWTEHADRSIAVTGAGGIHSTVADLRRWHHALTENRLLEPDTTAMMFDAPLTLSGKKSRMGMGWLDETAGSHGPRYDGLRVFSAIDTEGGVASSLTFFPDEELTIILLANTGSLPEFLADSFTEYLIRVPSVPRRR